jgi:serine phosphatase RsbU (regulator of sigma subunit)
MDSSVLSTVNTLLDSSDLTDTELFALIIKQLPESTHIVLVEDADPIRFDLLTSHHRPILRSDNGVNALLMQVKQPYNLTAQESSRIVEALDPGTDCWLVPLSHPNRKLWLLVMAMPQEVSIQSLQNVYFLQAWLFSQQQLRSTQKELIKAKQWIENELEEISNIQQLLLPDKNLHIPGSVISYTYHAMTFAGGDYIDMVDLTKERTSGAHDVGVIVADVTGHGPSAAVEAAMLDAILRTFKPSEESEGPSEVLNYINQHFFTRKERGRFLTAIIFRYLADERMLSFANAGHPHAYIKRGDTLVSLKNGGIPIGVLRDYTWQSYKVAIEPGDVLFVYTDVVIETKNSRGEDFGFDLLEKALLEADSEPVKIIASVESKMKAFCECRSFNDDMTMCAIQFL